MLISTIQKSQDQLTIIDDELLTLLLLAKYEVLNLRFYEIAIKKSAGSYSRRIKYLRELDLIDTKNALTSKAKNLIIKILVQSNNDVLSRIFESQF